MDQVRGGTAGWETTRSMKKNAMKRSIDTMRGTRMRGVAHSEPDVPLLPEEIANTKRMRPTVRVQTPSQSIVGFSPFRLLVCILGACGGITNHDATANGMTTMARM